MNSELQTQLQQILGDTYRIERELGGGGMSRVFVATEAELDRQVVIKVPPPTIAAAMNVQRFRREIQLAARLNHPHIVPLLAAAAKDNLLYYTMPFIEGESLRARLLRSRQLPVLGATRILRDVAEALSYAHSRNVVHRDIKPENIILSRNHALVLDFGVSKALTSATEGNPDVASEITSIGVALGTPAYMAPEQAVADPGVDHRADIYALGVVGYEMLAGRTPFAGLNSQQMLSAQISSRPTPLDQLRNELPPGLAAIIMRCLAKNPADRWQSADDLHAALEPYSVTSGANTPSDLKPATAPPRFSRRDLTVAAVAVVAAIGVMIAVAVKLNQPAPSIVVGSTHQVTSAPGLEFHPSLSADGRMIAYVTGVPGRTQLFVRQVAGGRAIALTDSTLKPMWPEWNPDGSEILFTNAGTLMTVPALGGTPTPVEALAGLNQCSWSHSHDKFACANSATGGLTVIGRNGEDRRDLIPTDRLGVSAPAWSPNDDAIAFVRGNSGFLIGPDIGNIAPSSIWIIGAKGGTPVKVSDDSHLNTSPSWIDDGFLFVSTLGGARDIYMQRVNRDHTARGAAVRITTGLNPHTISVSNDGKVLTYSVFNTVANIWTASGDGSDVDNARNAKPVTTGSQTVEFGAVSPDGKWLVYDSNVNGNQDIYRVSLAGGEAEQLTKNSYDDFHPAWSPSGKEIVFYSLKNGTRDIFVMNADGTNVRPVFEGPGEQRLPTWYGNDAIHYLTFPDSVFEVKREGTGWSKPRVAASGGVAPSMYSPDGKWLVQIKSDGPYLSRPDGSNAQRISVKNPSILTGIAGAGPWSADSRHFYTAVRESDGTSSIWQIPVNGDAERRVLHFADPARQLYRSTFDVFGDRFYFTIGDRQSDIWTMSLKRSQ